MTVRHQAQHVLGRSSLLYASTSIAVRFPLRSFLARVSLRSCREIKVLAFPGREAQLNTDTDLVDLELGDFDVAGVDADGAGLARDLFAVEALDVDDIAFSVASNNLALSAST